MEFFFVVGRWFGVVEVFGLGLECGLWGRGWFLRRRWWVMGVGVGS